MKKNTKLNKRIPKEHQMKCERCGRILDLRDFNQVVGHGLFYKVKKNFICYTDEEIEQLNIQYSGSTKVGEPIFWTKDMKPIHIN